MKRINVLRKEMKRAYDQGLNYRQVGAIYRVSGGMAYRIINEAGYEPKEAHIRYILGLPALVPAPVCERCGEVHISRRCTRRPKPVRRWRDLPALLLRWALDNREEL
jgi:hypothetical protein